MDQRVSRPTTQLLPESFSNLRVFGFRCRQAVSWCLHVELKKVLGPIIVRTGIILRACYVSRLGLRLLLFGRRVDEYSSADTAIRKALLHDSRIGEHLAAALPSSPAPHPEACAERSLILKVPRIEGERLVEKGALVFKFTETFSALLKGLDVSRLATYFRIVLEPSSVGYSLPEILFWSRVTNEKVFVMAPYEPDYDLLRNLGTNLVPIELGPADWVNPGTFYRAPEIEKKYDSIYIANYNPRKRVDRYLRAIVRVSRMRANYRGALVCASFGESESGLHTRDTVAWARERANLDFFGGMDQAQLNFLLNQSKVSVLLSLREGMNKGLAEGLFAGTPALLLRECACGNHRHINSSTGRIVPDAELESALAAFAFTANQYQPDEWAQRHISPTASTAVLSRHLREIEHDEGRRWHSSLLEKVNAPELSYLDESNNWLLPMRERLLGVFSKPTSPARISDFLAYLGEENSKHCR